MTEHWDKREYGGPMKLHYLGFTHSTVQSAIQYALTDGTVEYWLLCLNWFDALDRIDGRK